MITLEAKKLNLLQAIMDVQTDAVIEQMSAYLEILNGAGGLSPETQAQIEQSRREYAEGKVISFDSAEEAQEWLAGL